MNKARRKTLARIASELQDLLDALEPLMEEEQDAFDNLPESFQTGTQGEAMEESISAMSDAISSITEAIEYLETAGE